MSPDQLQIRLLGPLDVSREGEEVELPPSRKARALLAYLVALRRPVGRSALCDLFWQEVNDPRAGLRWALSRLRQVVDHEEHPRIVTPRDQVGFEPCGVEVDLHRLEAGLAGAPSGNDPGEGLFTGELEALTGVFRGEFLEDADLPDCHGYQAWLLGMRERVRSTRIRMLRALVRQLREDPERALPHALELLESNPYTERSYLTAMGILVDLGRPARALELHDRCLRMLREHLELPPSPELKAAGRRIRSVAAGAPRAAPEPEGPFADPEHLPPLSPDEPPMVGRDCELEELRGLWRRTGEGAAPPAALLTGEVGIGKTRLLRQFVAAVQTEGGWILSGPVFENEETRPYGPWLDMLRALPRSVIGTGGGDGALELLLGPGTGSADEGSRLHRARLFEEVAGVLRRLTGERGPGAIILDDVQWLDPSSAALLHFLLRILASEPLLVVLAGRKEEIRSGSVVAGVLRSLEAGGRLRHIPLERLAQSEVQQLLEVVAPDLDVASVFRTSEGNPFFALALAGSLQEGLHHPGKTVEEELDHRLDRLDPEARAVLPWAAALGRSFDLQTLIRALDRPASAVVEVVERLERRRILRTAGPDRYDFTHSLLREAAYRRPSEPARRAIHRGIAEALDGLQEEGARSPGTVARHAQLGGLRRRAARAYLEAAEESLWLLAYQEAAVLVDRGLDQASGLPDAERIPLEMDLLRIHSFRSMRDHRPAEVEDRVRQVTGEARELGLTRVMAVGHALLMDLEYQRGAFQEAKRSSVRYAETGREEEPTLAIRSLAETAACLLILDQAPEDARRLEAEAARLAREHRIEMDVTALSAALLAHHDGELDVASRAFRRVVRLGRRDRDRWWEAPARTRMIMVELDRGDPAAALERADRAVELAERMGEGTELAFARGFRAVASRRWGLDAQVGEGADRAGGETGEGAPPGKFEDALDEALGELRTLDSLWEVGQLQAYGAELELSCGRPKEARRRAMEAIRAGRTLNRPSLVALCRGLLARCALLEGDPREAEDHLSSQEAACTPDHLSHRARTALAEARTGFP